MPCRARFQWRGLHALRRSRLAQPRHRPPAAAGREDAVGAHLALGDDALTLAEQVRQDAVIGDRELLGAIGDAEGDRVAVVGARQAVLLDEAADADAALGADMLLDQIARAV